MTGSGETALALKKSEADVLRVELKKLRDTIESGYIEFSKKLWEAMHGTVNDDPLYQVWGYATFEDYAQSELGMKRGKAYYLSQIWEELHVKAKIPEKTIASLPWSHAKELAPLARSGGLTEKNVDGWVKKAKLEPVHQFAEEAKKAVQAHVSGTSDPPETIHRITVGLYEEQYRNFERAIEIAKTLAESDKTGHLIDLICTEFNAQYASQTKVDRGKAIKRYVAMMERTFGVRVLVLDPKNDEVLAGKDIAKDLGTE